MFFILSKILLFLFMPMSWLLAMLLWAFFTKKPKRRKYLLGFAIIFAFISFNQYIAMSLMGAWELKHKPQKDKVYDYAVVLGGMTDMGRKDGFFFHKSADRLWQVLPLYYSGQVKKILFTGGSGRIIEKLKPEAEIVQDYLRKIQFPDSALVIEQNSRNTYENALYTSEILGAQKDSVSILLVTSAFHMRRSQGIFEKQNFKFDMFTTDEYYRVGNSDIEIYLFPSSDALRVYELLIREIIGYVVYDVVGYI